MNLNDEENDLLFNHCCLELGKLLRTEQTEDFLHLYDNLPSEWNGARLEAAKEYIRQLQELDENEFQRIYQRAFNNEKANIMLNLPIKIRNDNDDDDDEQTTINNLVCDEKYSSSIKKTNDDETNSKTRCFQSINNNNTDDLKQNNCGTRTPTDSSVQLNQIPAIDITVEDYKKTRVPTSTSKSSNINNRLSIPQSMDVNESNQQSIIQNNILKKSPISMKAKSHEDASFDYFTSKNDNNDRQNSRSSSSSPTNSYLTSSNNKNDLNVNQSLLKSNSFEHSKLITNNDLDSHGSSIATKSSSENSGSARTASGSDSDDEHHHSTNFVSTAKSLNLFSTSKLLSNDNTPTVILNKVSDNRLNQHDRISTLPEQESYELVKLNSNDEQQSLGASQLPRLKFSTIDDPNGNNNNNYNSTNDILSYTTQRSPPINSSSSSSSHQNRYEQFNANHSNSSRKTSSRQNKKRKQLQQQGTIRTELIPGHCGDRDVDELVMFIDGNSSSKQQSRQNSSSVRSTDSNSNNNNNNNNNPSTSRRKSRKPIQILQQSNENKTLQIDEDTQLIGFIDDDDNNLTRKHSNDVNETNLNIVENDTTNGETLNDWLEPRPSRSPTNDDNDSLLLSSSTTLNNSNSEITSEPFVTVTHRRRVVKDRRQDNNNNLSRLSRYPPISNSTNDKRRFQLSSSTQNGTMRSNLRHSLSNIKPFVSSTTTTTKEEEIVATSSNSKSSEPVSQTTSVTTNSTEHLSSHSSTSSLPSLNKRQSKLPPVVFLNKSADIELNDVSFGFDVENSTPDKPSTPIPIEKDTQNETNTQTFTQSNDLLTNSKTTTTTSSSRRFYNQQRNNRGPLFYSGSDIRPHHHHHHHHHHRNYSSQTSTSQSSYIDPLLLLPYNQTRFPTNYSSPLAYMNLFRTPYISSQSPYVFIPTTQKDNDDDIVPTSEQIQEPLLVYATIPNPNGSIYLHPTKKSFHEIDQTTTIPTICPTQYFYPTQTAQHLIPSHAAYFQPISSSSLNDIKSQQDHTDDDEFYSNYDKSTPVYHQTIQPSSSHIMSNALHLVYSQEKRNVQTDRFNLDQLTAYLAMKWTETIDHYEQGDDEILLTGE